jgi:hypothetical protein
MLNSVLTRFVHQGFPPEIKCESGWYDLIRSLDAELSAIDPTYTIYQIKEKFGVLRVYVESSASKKKIEKMNQIIRKYELLSSTVCEITGTSGRLMRKDGVYKTLNPHKAPNGYEIV